MTGKFTKMSFNINSYHVVQWLLEFGATELCELVMTEIESSPQLPNLIINQYGNYVIQKLLRRAKLINHPLFERLSQFITINSWKWSNNPLGKHVVIECHRLRQQWYESFALNIELILIHILIIPFLVDRCYGRRTDAPHLEERLHIDFTLGLVLFCFLFFFSLIFSLATICEIRRQNTLHVNHDVTYMFLNIRIHLPLFVTIPQAYVPCPVSIPKLLNLDMLCIVC